MSNKSKYWYSSLSGDIHFLVLLVGLLLLIPKISLVSIPGGSPLRIDDLLIFFISGIFFVSLCYAREIKVSKFELSFILFFFAILISNIVNMILFDRSNILYSIRSFEYFIFFYVGYLFAKKHALYTLLKYYLILTAIFVFIQYFLRSIHSLLPSFIHADGIVVGLTAGPWELGAVMNIIFVLYAFNQSKPKVLVWKIFILTVVFIALTGSRSPLAAHFLLLIAYLFLSVSWKKRFKLIVSLPIILGIFYFVFVSVDLPVKERSQQLLSYDNITLVSNYYESVEISPLGLGFDNSEIKNQVDRSTGDYSWAIRSLKWVYAWKLWLSSDVSVWVGVGSGTFGRALDGGIVRVVTEFGIVGSVLFLLMLYRASAIYGRITLFLVLALLFNMLMIDAHNAYKVMSLFYFILGYLLWKREKRGVV